MRQMQGGGGRGAMSFGRSRARLLGEDQVKVTFADVAGVDEAKDEVKELVDFLRDPTKFQNLGGVFHVGCSWLVLPERVKRSWQGLLQVKQKYLFHYFRV